MGLDEELSSISVRRGASKTRVSTRHARVRTPQGGSGAMITAMGILVALFLVVGPRLLMPEIYENGRVITAMGEAPVLVKIAK